MKILEKFELVTKNDRRPFVQFLECHDAGSGLMERCSASLTSDTWRAGVRDHAILEHDRGLPEPQVGILFARLRGDPRRLGRAGRPTGNPKSQ